MKKSHRLANSKIATILNLDNLVFIVVAIAIFTSLGIGLSHRNISLKQAIISDSTETAKEIGPTSDQETKALESDSLKKDSPEIAREQTNPITPSKKPSSNSSTAPEYSPDNEPFRVTQIVLSDAFAACYSGTPYLTVYEIMMLSNNIRGGNVTWKFESRNDLELDQNHQLGPRSNITYPRQVTFNKGEDSAYIDASTPRSPGVLLSYRINSYKPDAIRVRVTSPNSAVSPWLQFTNAEIARCKD